MTSGTPSKPLNIGSPRSEGRLNDSLTPALGSYASNQLHHPQAQLLQRQEGVSASPRPDFERLREQFGGTPPPNIPPRGPVLGPPVGTSGSPFVRGGGILGPSTNVGSYASSNLAGIGRQSPALGSRPGTPKLGGGAGRESADPYAPPETLDDLPDEEKAKVLRRHLVHREQRNQGQGIAQSLTPNEEESRSRSRTPVPLAISSSRASFSEPHQQEDTEPFPIPYNAPGADVTHDIYKWQSDLRKQQSAKRSRSVSFPPTRRPDVDPAFEHIREPGGFRRNYLLLKATEQGVEQPQMLNNFVDFLFLYGHFAGEDLEEDEDELEEIPDEEEEQYDEPHDDEALIGRSRAGPSSGIRARAPLQPDDIDKPLETTPLIRQRSVSHVRAASRARRKRRSSIGPHGDATVPQAVLMLLKSFIGTGVLFLGKAFYNGGMLFSAVTLVSIAAVSLYSFLLLVQTKFVVPGSFGDIGGALYGHYMRQAILFSIVISQIGFVAAYIIFVAQNLQAFVMAVTNCTKVLPIVYLIAVQLVIFLPLSLIRNLAKLSTTALVADAFILVGLVYIAGNEIAVIAERGVAEIKMFNEKSFPLLIGTAVFSFEGIGLVIPITDSMREPRKFPKVLTGVMIFLTLLFGGAGMLSYAAYGPEIQTVVIVNLPQDQKFVQVVQFLYSMAILLSAPLQLFPALRIMENALWGVSSGKLNPRVKWEKNGFRTLVVVGCTLISWAGAKDLDKFVSFVGSFCCIPLCYIYPAMLHLKAVAKTRAQRIKDWLLIIFGMIVTVYTSVGTIKLMLEPRTGGDAPQFGRCAPSNPDDPSKQSTFASFLRSVLP
ncbi:neutral amino acid transporter [Tulasnella sp. 419]|nr:neutral amino acid transporter [Tulasnella sp. 419]